VPSTVSEKECPKPDWLGVYKNKSRTLSLTPELGLGVIMLVGLVVSPLVGVWLIVWLLG
jgi:hypothetical protein